MYQRAQSLMIRRQMSGGGTWEHAQSVWSLGRLVDAGLYDIAPWAFGVAGRPRLHGIAR
jgi:hypothetical protein